MSTTFNDDVGIKTSSPGSPLDVKGTLRLSGATSGHVGLTPATAAGSTTYTLPSADGTSGQVLTTDGAGTLSWATPGSGLSQDFRGLSLCTHPDADKAASHVYLNHADEIVMDTGNRVSSWDDLSANIASSGAGGLDAGSEQASTWYEIYAIRKSSNGDKNLLLHRAKDYFLDESQTTNDSGVGLRSNSSVLKVGETFDTDVTGPMEFVDVTIRRVLAPTGNLWISQYATSGGVPTGSALKTSDKLNVALISTSDQVVRFVFRDPPTLTAGTTYAWILEGDFTVDAANYLSVRGNSAGGYAAGAAYYWDGAAWQLQGGGFDFYFKVYITENDAAVTMPSGYDQKCKVGYVYNDSGSDLDRFMQFEHTVQSLQGLGTFATVTATVSTLTDYSSRLPPQPVAVSMLMRNSTALVNMSAFGVPYGYSGAVLAAPAFFQNPAADCDCLAQKVLTEFQGLYLAVSGGTGLFRYPSSWRW